VTDIACNLIDWRPDTGFTSTPITLRPSSESYRGTLIIVEQYIAYRKTITPEPLHCFFPVKPNEEGNHNHVEP
jgi:hypothetical protein